MENTTVKPSPMPLTGSSAEEILNQLKGLKAKDVPWKTGKVLAYIYGLDDTARNLVETAYAHFLHENGLDPTAFPSLLKIENDLIASVRHLLQGDENVVGNFTSGGTESIMLSLKTARDYFRHHRPEIKRPEVIVSESTHPAFQKACHYLDMDIKVLPINTTTFKADPAAIEAAITENTVMLVASTPCYPFGVIDPVEEIAALAKARGIFCHVDACVGGMYLPFLRKLGHDIPKFDFAVDGVTSISCDLHKYGYAAKGASTILYKNDDIRRFQIYTCANWSGYTLSNSTVLSSKTGGPMAGAWAIFNYWGEEGYKKVVKATQDATQMVLDGIKEIPQLEVLGDPVMNLVAMVSNDENLSVFDISDMMQDKGWHIQVQLASPASKEAIHLNVNKENVPHIPQLIQDLKDCITALGQPKSEDAEGMAIDPAIIQGLFANFSPEVFESMQSMLGMGGGQVPDKLGFISTILNSLNIEQRNMVITEFMNKMFTPTSEE